MVEKVISGGQIGADIAGVAAARELGIPTGGWMPKGFRRKDGDFTREQAALYGFEQTEWTRDYPPRTALNVQNSDGTIRFAYDFESPGERCTLREIMKAGKPSFDVWIEDPTKADLWPPPAVARRWLQDMRIRTLNVAGNANPAITLPVYEYLLVALL